MSFFQDFTDRQLIAAHRGYRSLRPENTRCAFEASLGHCHFIELDIQMSRDGVAVIHHDNVVGRTSNGRQLAAQIGRKSLRIDEWDLRDLRRLDFGSWFLRSDPFQTVKNGLVTPIDLIPLLPQRIMTLGELLSWRERRAIPLNIEIKDHRGRHHHKTVVDVVLEEIASAGCEEMVLISSFNHQYLRRVKQLMPKMAIGVLQDDHHPDDLIGYLSSLDAAAYHPAEGIIKSDEIRYLRENGFGVNVFTVNDRRRQRDLFAAGASAVFTDFPALAGR
ncbi:MAG: glycerophosphodiester phosphodiesterase [Desulforhopalus sp.]